MNSLLGCISNFFTAIVKLYPQIPHELSEQLKTMQAFLKSYEDKQLFLIQNFVRRVEAKLSFVKSNSTKDKKQKLHHNVHQHLKTQPDTFDDSEQYSINNEKQNDYNFINNVKIHQPYHQQFSLKNLSNIQKFNNLQPSNELGKYFQAINIQKTLHNNHKKFPSPSKFQPQQNRSFTHRESTSQRQKQLMDFTKNSKQLCSQFNLNKNDKLQLIDQMKQNSKELIQLMNKNNRIIYDQLQQLNFNNQSSIEQNQKYI